MSTLLTDNVVLIFNCRLINALKPSVNCHLYIWIIFTALSANIHNDNHRVAALKLNLGPRLEQKASSSNQLYANHRMDVDTRDNENDNTDRTTTSTTEATTTTTATTSNNTNDHINYTNDLRSSAYGGANHAGNFANKSDRHASDSILRPQLALQIYASPAINHQTSAISPGPAAAIKGSDLFAFNQHLRAINQSQNQFLTNHQQKQPRANHWLGSSSSNQQNAHNHQRFHLSPMANEMADSVWQYDAMAQANEQLMGPNYLAYGNQLEPMVGPTGASMGPGPTINAIITLPPSGEESQAFHRSLRGQRFSQTSFGDPIEQSIISQPGARAQNGSINVEGAISKLLDSQASGNIEFSMNLNGDEIVINPISRHATAMLSSSLNTDHLTDQDKIGSAAFKGGSKLQGPTNGRRTNGTDSNGFGLTTRSPKTKFVDDFRNKQSVSRSIRGHISSELAGAQLSASEIDLVDGTTVTLTGGSNDGLHQGTNSNNTDGDEDDEDDDGDGDENELQATASLGADENELISGDAKVIKRNKLVKADASDKPKASGGGSVVALWPDNGLNSTTNGRNKDVAEEEAASGGRAVPTAESEQSVIEETTNGRYRAGVGGKHQARNSKSTFKGPVRFKAGPKSRLTRGKLMPQTKARRKSSPGAKMGVHDHLTGGSVPSRSRNSPAKLASQGNRGGDAGGQTSTVVIKREDLRKFEQLLENLRSLSLNNMLIPNGGGGGGAKTRPSSNPQAGSQLALGREGSATDELADDDAALEEDSSDEGGDSKRQATTRGSASRASNPLAKGTMASRSIDALNIDCDHRRQQAQRQHRLQKAATMTNSKDSAQRVEPGMQSDGDSMIAVDKEDELNSDRGQGGESDEDGGGSGDGDGGYSPPSSLIEPSRSAATSPMEVSESDPSPRRAGRGASRPLGTLANQAKSVFVRKTVLQTYFDNKPTLGGANWTLAANQTRRANLNSNGPNKTPSDYHSTRSNGALATRYEGRAHLANFKDSGALASRLRGASRSVLDGGDSRQALNYIDYNRLDDRNVYRGDRHLIDERSSAGETRHQVVVASAPSD